MDAKLIIVLLMAIICTSSHVLGEDNPYYSAVVVEYSPVTDSNDEIMLEKNFEKYKRIIENDYQYENKDIVVFPEGGLTKNVFVTVPDPVEHVSPCVSNNYEFGLIKNLSCLALHNSIYLVVNLLEKREITGPGNKKKVAKYNTNVAFDRQGIVVARYAKYNLFDEQGIDKPSAPEISIFETDFGVRFGMFTCFDILFKEPALTLLKDHEITDILFPTQWFSELPFLTAIQVQQGWAQAHNVNLLASGYNNLSRGSTGSGIYHGSVGSLTYVMGTGHESKLLHYNVPKIQKKVPSEPLSASFVNFNAASHLKDDVKSYDDNMVSSQFQHTDFHLLSDQIQLFDSLKIKIGVDFAGYICTNKNFCCHFTVRIDRLSGGRSIKDYNYRAVAFHGVRRFGSSFTGGVQACAVILCTGPHITDCTSRPFDFSGSLEISKLQVEGSFNSENSMQIPTTLAGSNVLATLAPSRYKYQINDSKEENIRKIKMELKSSVFELITFGIWGRDFTLDGKPPSPPVSKAPRLTSFLTFFLVSLVFVFLLGHRINFRDVF